jgi:hypothetical protein
MFFAILSISGTVLVSGATVGGRIAGKVIDASGAVIPETTVAITNTGTGLLQVTKTNAIGAYSFPILPVGHYTLNMTATGFRPYLRDNIAVNVDSSLIVDAQLEVGGTRETVTVQESGLEVETSSTQMGEVLTTEIVTSLPLNGRSFTDLLALQPGVLPAATLTAAAVQGLGQTVFSPSGDLNPGMVSINGQRESANGYIVNGASAEEKGSMAAAIIPNLDSIAEFRILTNNYDAEYGNYSGGQINVITKSGTQHFHGDIFEFNRNTAFDAAPPLSETRNEFKQNQYGGTLGGPLGKNAFFFVDYQGTKQMEGVPTGLITVPSLANRKGDFSAPADFSTLAGSVSGSYLATLLTRELDTTISVGEPYRQVFPNGIIPQSAWSAPAKYLMQYIPMPSASATQFSSSAYNQILNDNKGAVRIDTTTGIGALSFYYAIDNYTNDNPYPTSSGGANVPGFNALSMGRSQLFTVGLIKNLHERWVNDFHVSYTRDVTDLGQPEGGLGVSLATQGFAAAGSNGIYAGAPALEGIENVAFNNYSIGVTPYTFDQINNTYELRESVSTIAGRHMVKFGGDFDYDQINTYPEAQLNGGFQFYGTETGSDFADYLLGVASQYNQNALRPFYGRNKYAGLYLQDTWRARSNLTVNAGIRWDRIEPWYEKYNNLMTIVPGQQCKVFPTAPTGLVYPGDPGIPRTLAPPGDLNFAPRIGIAYAPSTSDATLLGKIIGGAGRSSIRAGYGIYFINVTEETLSLTSDNAPYGFTYTSPAPPLFATPFVDAATGNLEGQRFPAILAPLNVSRNNPDPNVNWAQFEPLSAIPGYSPTNRTAYAEQYMLSMQRQIEGRSILSVSYVGSQAHRLLVLESANPGNGALCLSLPGCGPFGESATYVTASGNTINGTRTTLGPAFGNVSYQKGIGNSNYDAFQTNYRFAGKRLVLNAAYTYAKSLDQGSNFGEQVNPLNPNLSRGLSSFDMRHNFVVSYRYELPFDALLHSQSRWLTGWSVAGVTHFCTGVPVTLYNTADISLIGTMSNGVNNLPVDEPNYLSGPLHINHHPGNGQFYFNTSLFSMPSLGEVGTSRRRFFSGPAMDNYDMSLEKTLRISESKSFLLRIEAFNVFNHAQFFGPDTVGGNINSSTFGQVVKADAPRLVQLAAKVSF